MNGNISVERKTSKSLKWTFLGEITAKLISPITNMILARLLLPEAFGIVATISIVISLSELLADSGFSKAIIQKDYDDEIDFSKSANTAFWATFIVAIVFFLVIAVFKDSISSLVGSPGYGIPLLVAAIQIPIFSLSSINLAVLKRNFEFKKIFWLRFASAIIPLIVATTMASLGFSFWSLIISGLASTAIQAILVIVFSKWKPKFSFSYLHFKKMLSFSALNLVEAFLVWLTSSITVFVITHFFDASLTGMYKLSVTTVNSLLNIVTAVFTPVLFSSLSRLKDDESSFKTMFSKFQKMISLALYPLGVGIFLYRDLATKIFFGDGWQQIVLVVGVYTLISAFIIPINHLASIVYFSKKKPIFSIISQIVYGSAILIISLVTPKYGFDYFVIARGIVTLTLAVTSLIFLNCFFGISIKSTAINLLPAVIGSLFVFGVGFILRDLLVGLWWDIIVISICVIVYFSILFLLFKKDVLTLIDFLFKKKRSPEKTDNYVE